MRFDQTRRFAERLPLTLAFLSTSVLASFIWPRLLERPQAFAAIQLIAFVVVVGLITHRWRLEIRRSARTGISKTPALSLEPVAIIAPADRERSKGRPASKRFISYSVPEGPVQLNALWQPEHRISWILQFTGDFPAETQKQIEPYARELRRCATFLFVRYPHHAEALRSTVAKRGSFEMLLLEHQPVIGALVEDVFQEYGILVRRLPLAPELPESLYDDSLSEHHQRTPTYFSIRYFARDERWPMRPLACLAEERVLDQLLPTDVEGVSKRYIAGVRRYLETVVAIDALVSTAPQTD